METWRLGDLEMGDGIWETSEGQAGLGEESEGEAFFAEKQEVGGGVLAALDLGAEGDVAGEGEGCPGVDRLGGGTGPAEEPDAEGVFDVGEGVGIAEHTEGVFDHVGEKVSGVEGGVTDGGEIEVDDPQATGVDEDLVGIEIAMEECGLGGGELFGESGALVEHVQDALAQGGLAAGGPGQLDAKVIEFVGHGVSAGDGVPAAMEFEQGVGGAGGEARCGGIGEV